MEGNALPKQMRQQPLPAAIDQGGNPFRDDRQTLPAPANHGAGTPGPVERHRLPAVLPTPVPRRAAASTNGGNPFARAAQTSYAPTSASVPPTVTARPAPPVRILAPIKAPESAQVFPAVTSIERPASAVESLAGLEKMVDVPRANKAAAAPGAVVVQNDFAPATQPFRLATRSTWARDADNPALETETLSALETMMSNDALPAAKR
jgi:hypothetical protein